MKKALAGPAKRTAKKKPERRAMIAAAGRRIRAATMRLDRGADRLLQRASGPLRGLAMRGRALGLASARRLRPLGALLFRLLGRAERLLLRFAGWSGRAATRGSVLLTPRRAICFAVLAAAGCLVASQFVDYRAVEVGQAGYAGLPATSAPTVGGETAGAAHAYLLVAVGMLTAALALAALRDERRRGLGRAIFALGALSLAVALLVDLPAGRDLGAEASRFSGARAVLEDGFYAEIAAAAGLMLGGMLLLLAPKATARYYARPCRTRTNLLGRAASALRRRRRRRASSRARGARRGSRRRSGAASAPASPR